MGQTYNNIKYILEQEGDLPRGRKAYLLNRILDKGERDRLLELLRSHNVPEDMIFERRINWDNVPPGDDERLNYFTAINEARNMALEHSFFSGAKWVVLNDGNVFVPLVTWRSILDAMKDPKVLYIATPHVRLTHEQDRSWFTPNTRREDLAARSKIANEPQEGAFSFRHDSPARFKEHLPYGKAEKWELLEELCGTAKPDIRPRHPENYPSCKRIHNAVVRMWPFPEKGAEVAITDSGKRWHLRNEAITRFKAAVNKAVAAHKSSFAQNGVEPSLSVVPVHHLVSDKDIAPLSEADGFAKQVVLANTPTTATVDLKPVIALPLQKEQEQVSLIVPKAVPPPPAQSTQQEQQPILPVMAPPPVVAVQPQVVAVQPPVVAAPQPNIASKAQNVDTRAQPPPPLQPPPLQNTPEVSKPQQPQQQAQTKQAGPISASQVTP
jgi:hypothetical protein